MPNFSNGPAGVTFTGRTTFQAAPDVTLAFIPDTWIVENTGTDQISFSFDGVNVHGTVDAGGSQQRATARTRIWLREEGGGGTGVARVNADTRA